VELHLGAGALRRSAYIHACERADSFTMAFALTGSPPDSRNADVKVAVGPCQAALLAKDGSPGMPASCATPAGAHSSEAAKCRKQSGNQGLHFLISDA